MVACVGATLGSATATAKPFVRLPSVGQFAVLPSSKTAIVNVRSPGNGLPGQPYTLRTAGVGSLANDSSVGFSPFSSLPIETAIDPRSTVGRMLVYSQCQADATSGVVTCGLLAHDLAPRSPVLLPSVGVTEVVPGARDRLPSTYGNATVFVRTLPGSSSGQLRLASSFGAPSVQLSGGPAGKGASTASGTALRGTSVAHVWRWTDTSGTRRSALRLQRIEASPKTVLSMPSTRGVLVGPSWQGSRLIFAVRRRSGASTWYRYDPSTRRYQSAPGPRNIGSIAATNTFVYWQTAGPSALRTGICSRPGCALEAASLVFHRSRMPR